MSNEILWIGFLLLQFGLTFLIYKQFGLTGLYTWIGFSIVVANIQVLKTIELFGLTATLGNIIYASIYLSTDLISEKYGKDKAKKAVYIGFFSMIAFTLIMQYALKFAPAADDFAQESLQMLFGLLPRIAAGSLVAYIVSQLLDVTIFFKIKEKFGKPSQLWIRNNGSTLVSQLIDSVIFVVIAFYGIFPNGVLLEIIFTTYVIKALTAVLDTPFVYLMRKVKPNYEVSIKKAA